MNFEEQKNLEEFENNKQNIYSNFKKLHWNLFFITKGLKSFLILFALSIINLIFLVLHSHYQNPTSESYNPVQFGFCVLFFCFSIFAWADFYVTRKNSFQTTDITKDIYNKFLDGLNTTSILIINNWITKSPRNSITLEYLFESYSKNINELKEIKNLKKNDLIVLNQSFVANRQKNDLLEITKTNSLIKNNGKI